MPLTIQQLTDDGSFLITFAPPFAPIKHKADFPGSFTILVDPWLHGATTIFHPKFAQTQHTSTPTIRSLSEIQGKIDLIVISQERADHLHKETLCTLPKHCSTTILAPPRAARKIREWQHFERTDIVQVLKPYKRGYSDNVVRIPIAAYSSASAEGEVTIANISEKRDLIGLHNAIAITYCPPGTLLTAPNGTVVKMADMPMMAASRPSTAIGPTSPTSFKSSKQRYFRGSLDDVNWTERNGRTEANDDDDFDATIPRHTQSRADSPLRRPSTSGSRAPSIKSVKKRPDNFEDVLSVVYTPHGTGVASLRPYIDNHLSSLGTTPPVTMLIHGLTLVSNPWWMGGVVCTGAPGGVKIARDVRVKYWLSAHDEIKESEGFATRWTTNRRYDAHEVTKMLREADGLGGGIGLGTEVVVLKTDETRRFTA